MVKISHVLNNLYGICLVRPFERFFTKLLFGEKLENEYHCLFTSQYLCIFMIMDTDFTIYIPIHRTKQIYIYDDVTYIKPRHHYKKQWIERIIGHGINKYIYLCIDLYISLKNQE